MSFGLGIKGALGGAAQGASIGSAIPGLGTALGGVIGGGLGLLGGLFGGGNNTKDQERLMERHGNTKRKEWECNTNTDKQQQTQRNNAIWKCGTKPTSEHKGNIWKMQG